MVHRPIRRALLSVSDKTGLINFAKTLVQYDVEILSTGGTAQTLREAGLSVRDIAEVTAFPEMMDGRVKTLHPSIHAGILACRDNPTHIKSMAIHGIVGIDMVVVNLYPFVQKIENNEDIKTCIDTIDIGGPAMIRAAAKNHAFVTVITDPADYVRVMQEMAAHKGAVSMPMRKALAAEAFALTAAYDARVAEWMINEPFPSRLTITGTLAGVLRYGENPHQAAALYYLDGDKRTGPARALQAQGKVLSYNNILDADAAFGLVAEFVQPALAIVKHANPCGVAIGGTMIDAYARALACDPVSAFGGIVALNRPLDAATATAIVARFVEVIVAPCVEEDALPILKSKPAIRVLTTGAMPDPRAKIKCYRHIIGGLLVEDFDSGQVEEDDLRVVTDRKPSEAEIADMLFAFRVAKHVKSNAIVYAKDLATVGIGAGQMSRVDSVRIAASKAIDVAGVHGVPLTRGSVVASDAFFPFADGLIKAAEAGVTAVIQPGGSVRDAEVIEAANAQGLAMVFTAMRHFKT